MTFDEVAELWAQERARVNQNLFADKYLDKLFSWYWSGDFEDDYENSVATLVDTTGGRRTPEPYPRRKMLRILPLGEDWVPDHVRSGASEDVGEATWNAWATLPMRRYPEAFRRQMGSISAPVDHFRKVIQDRGERLPRFLRDQSNEPAPPGRPTHMPAIEIEMRRRADVGELRDTITDEAHYLAEWAVTNFSKESAPARNTIVGKLGKVYRDLKGTL